MSSLNECEELSDFEVETSNGFTTIRTKRRANHHDSAAQQRHTGNCATTTVTTVPANRCAASTGATPRPPRTERSQQQQQQQRTERSQQQQRTLAVSTSEVCRYYSRGMCRFGEVCRFAHVLSDDAQTGDLCEYFGGEEEERRSTAYVYVTMVVKHINSHGKNAQF